MVRTRVGYAGGSTAEPTYHDLADHTEVIQLDFDADRLAYADLIRDVWANRRGGGGPVHPRYRQYMEAVFCADEAEAAIVRGIAPTAQILTGSVFYRAENYHQKYYLQHDRTLWPEVHDLDSTQAARLNGYVAGRGTIAGLKADLPVLALSAVGEAYLTKLVARRASSS